MGTASALLEFLFVGRFPIVEVVKFLNEVRGKDGPVGPLDIRDGPETPLGYLLGTEGEGAGMAVEVALGKLRFHGIAESILVEEERVVDADSQLFPGLPKGGLPVALPGIEVSPYRCIPLQGLDILFGGALLKEEFPLGIDNEDMDRSVDQTGVLVALAPQGRPDSSVRLVDNIKDFHIRYTS